MTAIPADAIAVSLCLVRDFSPAGRLRGPARLLRPGIGKRIFAGMTAPPSAGSLSIRYHIIWPSRRPATSRSRRKRARCWDTVETSIARNSASCPPDFSPSASRHKISMRCWFARAFRRSLAATAAACIFSRLIFIITYIRIFECSSPVRLEGFFPAESHHDDRRSQYRLFPLHGNQPDCRRS